MAIAASPQYSSRTHTQRAHRQARNVDAVFFHSQRTAHLLNDISRMRTHTPPRAYMQAHTPGHQPHHIHYGRRWGILGIVALLQLSNAMQWVNYAPVAQLAAAYYETSCGVIDGLSLCFMAVSIPGTFVSAFIFRKYGASPFTFSSCPSS